MSTITGCLAADHQRLGVLIEQIAADRSRFPEIARHLRDHLRFEEEVLFPMIEQTLCHAEGPVCVLRREHQQIEDHLCAMAAALFVRDELSFGAEHAALLDLLESHEGREERLVYPAMDRALDVDARDKLVDDIRLRL